MSRLKTVGTVHDKWSKFNANGRVPNLYVVHPRCVYAIDGGVGPSNTTELGSVLYWLCDDMFRPRKAIFRSISILQMGVSKN
jgi:hypothetical protein